MYLVGGLVDASGHILVPGIYDHVAPLTEEEKKMYEAVDLDLEEYRNSSQVKRFLFDTKVCPQDDGCLKAPVSQCGLTCCESVHLSTQSSCSFWGRFSLSLPPPHHLDQADLNLGSIT